MKKIVFAISLITSMIFVNIAEFKSSDSSLTLSNLMNIAEAQNENEQGYSSVSCYEMPDGRTKLDCSGTGSLACKCSKA